MLIILFIIQQACMTKRQIPTNWIYWMNRAARNIWIMCREKKRLILLFILKVHWTGIVFSMKNIMLAACWFSRWGNRRMEMKVTYKSHYLHEISVWQDVILMLTTDVISLNLTLGITVLNVLQKKNVLVSFLPEV